VEFISIIYVLFQMSADVSTQGELKHDGKKPSSDPTLGNVNVKPSAGPFIVVSEKSGGRFLTVNNKNTECTFVAAGSELNRIHKASVSLIFGVVKVMENLKLSVLCEL